LKARAKANIRTSETPMKDLKSSLSKRNTQLTRLNKARRTFKTRLSKKLKEPIAQLTCLVKEEMMLLAMESSKESLMTNRSSTSNLLRGTPKIQRKTGRAVQNVMSKRIKERVSNTLTTIRPVQIKSKINKPSPWKVREVSGRRTLMRLLLSKQPMSMKAIR
jgi:hypothetical protein